MKRHRLSLDVDADTKAKLEAIQTRMNTASMTDVIRRAIALLDVVTRDPAAHQAKKCPNCHRDAPSGLFSGDHGVMHCGCYYSRPAGIRPNYTAERDSR